MGTTSVALGLGYQTGSRDQIDSAGDETDQVKGNVIGASVTASMESGLTLGLSYASYSFDDTDVAGGDSLLEDYTTTGVAVSYTTGAMTLAANYGQKSYETSSNDADGWGAGVNYDLGGGAVVQAGMYEDGYSLGLGMSF